MSRNPLTRDSPMWDVVVEEHEVRVGPSRTLVVPARETRIGKCVDGTSAKLRVLKWAHSDAGVPPWKPCIRQSWPHVYVSRYMVQVV